MIRKHSQRFRFFLKHLKLFFYVGKYKKELRTIANVSNDTNERGFELLNSQFIVGNGAGPDSEISVGFIKKRYKSSRFLIYSSLKNYSIEQVPFFLNFSKYSKYSIFAKGKKKDLVKNPILTKIGCI